jgi:hypothetical protein
VVLALRDHLMALFRRRVPGDTLGAISERPFRRHAPVDDIAGIGADEDEQEDDDEEGEEADDPTTWTDESPELWWRELASQGSSQGNGQGSPVSC